MPDSDKSIIQIIQKMVQENESEDKIITTLESMGVDETQAKRLLLIAQADTFTLLNSELDKIVDQKLAKQKEQMQKESTNFISSVLEQKKKEIESDMDKSFLRYKNDILDNQKKFQTSVNDTISKVAKLNEQSYSMSEENKKMIEIVNKDLSETKLKGIKLRRSLARNLLLLVGVFSFIGAIIFLATTFINTFNVDYVTAAIILVLIGTALTYLSANV